MSPNNTRTRLLDIAERCFAEKGFAATSLRDIGNELEMANASLLYHFPSKRRIYAAVLERIAVSLHAVCDQLEGCNASQLDVGVALLKWATAFPNYVRIVQRELLDVAQSEERAGAAKRWYLTEPVDRLAKIIGGRQAHVALMHIVGSMSFFLIAAPTLGRMMNRPQASLEAAYRRFLRQQLE